jgi:hypothetical protein
MLLAARSEAFAQQRVSGCQAEKGEPCGEEGDVQHSASDPVRRIG